MVRRTVFTLTVTDRSSATAAQAAAENEQKVPQLWRQPSAVKSERLVALYAFCFGGDDLALPELFHNNDVLVLVRHSQAESLDVLKRLNNEVTELFSEESGDAAFSSYLQQVCLGCLVVFFTCSSVPCADC